MTEVDTVEAEDALADQLPASGPERRCIITGEIRPKAELLRFIVSPADEVVPDVDQRLPGRGIWLSPRRDVVNTAMAKRQFARAARRAVTAPEDLADRVERLLARRCLDALGLARRAGQAVCGFEKVRTELKSGRAAVLVQARDAAAAGREKMQALAGALGGRPLVELFDVAELGAIFGRENAVHVALAEGKIARRLVLETRLLAGFRPGPEAIVGRGRAAETPDEN